MEKKGFPGRDPLPPGLIRLAAVLAEIALNEADSAPAEGSAFESKAEQTDQDSPTEEGK